MSWVTLAAGLATLAAFVVVALRASIRTALPSDLHIDTANDAVVPNAMREKVREFEALGFRRLGAVRKVELVRPAHHRADAFRLRSHVCRRISRAGGGADA